ncbi:DUF5313 family protein [Saccharomonospora sp. CUA-673]|uniref:DUF5313 family protein n=1 Tax=Saccharomonospora sp. CUA-673 TaxID=1904969 RepID=UPI0021011EA9|nr:DUF5313 family protein [Saccharomonospora sp. CUA-673]
MARRADRVRPTPWQWLRYSVGGRLPEHLAPWVLRDATARGWRWRLAARNCVYVVRSRRCGCCCRGRSGCGCRWR